MIQTNASLQKASEMFTVHYSQYKIIGKKIECLGGPWGTIEAGKGSGFWLISEPITYYASPRLLPTSTSCPCQKE